MLVFQATFLNAPSSDLDGVLIIITLYEIVFLLEVLGP